MIQDSTNDTSTNDTNTNDTSTDDIKKELGENNDLIVKELIENIIGRLDLNTKEQNIIQNQENPVNYKNVENVENIENVEKEFVKLVNKKKSNNKKTYNNKNRHYIKEVGGDKSYASASVTFYHSKLGYLLSNEYRWGEKTNLYHLVGGKTELGDRDILYTGLREFVEESNMYMDSTIVRNGDIKYLTNKLYKLVVKKVKQYDLCVNDKKNLYHKFFIFNINSFDSLEIRNKIMGLPKFFEKLVEKDNKELNYLIWINNENKDKLNKEFSLMLNYFYSNIDNFTVYNQF